MIVIMMMRNTSSDMIKLLNVHMLKRDTLKLKIQPTKSITQRVIIKKRILATKNNVARNAMPNLLKIPSMLSLAMKNVKSHEGKSVKRPVTRSARILATKNEKNHEKRNERKLVIRNAKILVMKSAKNHANKNEQRLAIRNAISLA